MKYVIKDLEDGQYISDTTTGWCINIIDAIIYNTKELALDRVKNDKDYLTIIPISFKDLG